MKDIGLTPEVLRKITGLLRVLFPDATIYLYGSRARGTFDVRSDIDLAIDAGERVKLGEAKAVLEGLYVPQKFDLVDVHFISDDFKNEISRYWIKL
jgi:uncharacterized protein